MNNNQWKKAVRCIFPKLLQANTRKKLSSCRYEKGKNMTSKGGLEEEVLRIKKNSNWCSLVIENRARNRRLKLQTRG